jgi:hypothetical protein
VENDSFGTKTTGIHHLFTVPYRAARSTCNRLFTVPAAFFAGFQ